MTVPKSLRPLVLELARHEAAHFVAGRTLGFEVGDISLKLLDERGGHSGTSHIELGETTRDIGEVIDYLRRRLAVLYAGAVAQATVDGVPDQEKFNVCLLEGAAGDKSKADELLHILRNLLYPTAIRAEFEAQLTALETASIERAVAVTLAAQACIDAIAGELAGRVQMIGQKYTVSRAEIEALCPSLEGN